MQVQEIISVSLNAVEYILGYTSYELHTIFIGKCMFLGGLTPKSMCADDDHKLLEHGIGFTNVVMRATRGNANLTRKEIEEGKCLVIA